jgi:hypothetical protein
MGSLKTRSAAMPVEQTVHDPLYAVEDDDQGKRNSRETTEEHQLDNQQKQPTD